MRQRLLLIVGIAAIGAALLLGSVGMAVDRQGLFGNSRGPAISMDQAQSSVQSFLDRRGANDLRIDELLEFDQNFYALIKEKATGTGAFELLVDRRTGRVAFEPGPDMMWNAKYGMMGGAGHMGWSGIGASMSVGPERATQIAQGWLDQRQKGDSAGTPDAFYGYYTFHFEKNGRIAGMLSVNGQTGQVWFHSWHGNFIASREVG